KDIDTYNTTSGAYLTNIAGSRINTTNTITQAGTSVSPLLHGTVSGNGTSTLTAPITVMTEGVESAASSYNGTYAATTGISISNVTDNATWYGFWVTTLAP